MKIVDIKDKSSIQSAADVLKSGGVLIFPTDTVYGIGCALNDIAISRLYKIKNRPLTQPTAVLISKNDIPDILKKEFENHSAGQITIIADKNNYKILFPEILLKENKIGVRVPDDDWLQNLLEISGPIVASSANLAGECTPKSFNDINLKLLEQADMIIKSDKISNNNPSKIIDPEENKIIRP